VFTCVFLARGESGAGAGLRREGAAGHESRMASPAAEFRTIVFANTLRGCQPFGGMRAEDIDRSASS